VSEPRRYVSPKREAQAAATRSAILDAFVEQLSDPGRNTLSPSEAAAQAGVSVRTVHLQILPQRPAETKNVWPVRVEKTVFQGDFSQIHLAWGAQHLVARCAAMEPIAPGREVIVTVDPRRVVLLGS